MSSNAEMDLPDRVPPVAPGRAEAAAAVWNWRRSEHEEKAAAGPRPGALRSRGLVQGAVAGGIGTAVFLLWSPTFGTVILGFAALVAVSALLSPTGLYALLHRLFEATGRAAGIALTWLLLTPLFYGFFLPFGLIMRRGRRDRMKRFFEREATSYWEDYEDSSLGSGSLERQY